MDKLFEMLDALTLDELELAKTKITEIVKARSEAAKVAEKLSKEATKAAQAKQASDKLRKDAKQRVEFTLKGAKRTADVVKFTDKTVTVHLEEGVRYIKLANVSAVWNLDADGNIVEDIPAEAVAA